MELRKTVGELMAEALANVDTLDVAEARKLHDEGGVQFIDVRELHELTESGTIPGAAHAPRGMLEFLADPASPYHDEVFARDGKFVLFCAGGGRSSLAAWRLKEMGLENVCHIAGGFRAWREAGADVVPYRGDSTA